VRELCEWSLLSRAANYAQDVVKQAPGIYECCQQKANTRHTGSEIKGAAKIWLTSEINILITSDIIFHYFSKCITITKLLEKVSEM